MSSHKEELYKELEFKTKAEVEGINIDPLILLPLGIGKNIQEQIHGCFYMDHKDNFSVSFPSSFRSPAGFYYSFNWDPESKISIQLNKQDGKFYLYDDGVEKFPIEFTERPKCYDQQTSDGVYVGKIGQVSPEKYTISIAYSNECALKDKGLDCLFCNINHTKAAYGERQGIKWKSAKQIGEAVKKAFDLDGAQHVNITGGYIPERREVDYYLDVADAIKDSLGVEKFNGTAVIGAPKDLETIDKYAEAGYRTIGTNLEVWDEGYFKVICPGKVSECGTRDHWLETLEYEVTKFGRGRVRCGFVAGLEPKERTLEGVEYLAKRGIVSLTGAWNPNPGSALEGHRTPRPEWHFDMAIKTHRILANNGITFDLYADAAPSANFIVHDIFRIEEDLI